VPFLTVDISAASTMAWRFRGWGSQSERVVAVVLQAETLSGVASGVTSRLDQIAADGRASAAAMEWTVDKVTSFRIAPILSGVDPMTPELRAEADQIARRLRYGNGGNGGPDGWASEARDSARLRHIFGLAVGDPPGGDLGPIAQSAYELALRGYPMHKALDLDSQYKLDRVYGQVADAIQAGLSPAEASLAADLFPPQYRALHAPVVQGLNGSGHAASSTEPVGVEAEPRQLPGLGAQLHAVTAAGTSVPAAVSATARWIGPAGSRWAGVTLAARLADATPAEIVETSQILPADVDAAVAFVNELGASGTAAIPVELDRWGSDFLDSVVPNFAATLALATHHELLQFDGVEFIEAGHELAGQAAAPAELLLLDANYRAGFVVPAIATSLWLQEDGYSAVDLLHRFTSSPDVRSAALQSALVNDVAALVVVNLAGQGRLASLIDPRQGFRDDNQVGLGGLDQHVRHALTVAPAITSFLTAAATNEQAAKEVVAYLHESGEYEAAPLSSRLDDVAWQAIHDSRRIDDGRITTGISRLLVLSVPHFASSPGSVTTVDVLIDEPFLAAYNTVLVSGSGEHLFEAKEAVLASAVASHFEGAHTINVDSLADLLGAAVALRVETQNRNAALEDERRDDLSRDLSVLSMVAGPGAPKVAAAISVLSLVTGSQNTALDTSQRHLSEALQHGSDLRRAGFLALFGTGMVRTAGGKSVRLALGPAGDFRLFVDGAAPDGGAQGQVSVTEIHIEGWGEPPYKFEDLPSGFIAMMQKELDAGQVDVRNLLEQLEALDNRVETAQGRAGEQLKTGGPEE